MSLAVLIDAPPAYAYLAGGHWALAVKVELALPAGSKVRQAMKDYPTMVAWGSNGPDLPYALPDLAFGASAFGDAGCDTYHEDRVGAYAAELMRQAIDSKDEKQIAFAAGWVTHMCGDFWMHGTYGIDEKDADPVVWNDIADIPGLHIKGGLGSNAATLPTVYAPYKDGDAQNPDKFYHLFYVSGRPADLPCDYVYTTMQRDDKYGDIPRLVSNVNKTIILDSEGPLTYFERYPFDSDKFAEATRVYATILTAQDTWFTPEDPLEGMYYILRDHELGDYRDLVTAENNLDHANTSGMLRTAFRRSHQLAVDLLEGAERGDYSGFSDSWIMNDTADNGRGIGALKVVVETGTATKWYTYSTGPWGAIKVPYLEGPGTDATATLHVWFKDKTEEKWDLNHGKTKIPSIPSLSSDWYWEPAINALKTAWALDPLAVAADYFGLVDWTDTYNDFESGERDVYNLDYKNGYGSAPITETASDIKEIGLDLGDGDVSKLPAWDLRQLSMYVDNQQVFKSKPSDHWVDPNSSIVSDDGFDSWTPPSEDAIAFRPVDNVGETQATLWNGSFEETAGLDQAEHWSTIASGTGGSGDVVRWGGEWQGLDLANPDSEPSSTTVVFSDVFVDPGRDYLLTGYDDSWDVESSAVAVGADYLDSTGTRLGGETTAAIPSPFALRLGVAPTGTAEARVWFRLAGGPATAPGTRSALLRRISLIPNSPANPSFEQWSLRRSADKSVPTGWDSVGTVTDDPTWHHDGDLSVRARVGGSLDSAFEAFPGKTYTASVWAFGASQASISMSFLDADGNLLGTGSQTDGSQWGLNTATPAQMRVSSTAPAGAVTCDLRMGLFSGGVTDKVSFDDVAVTSIDKGGIEGAVSDGSGPITILSGLAGATVALDNGRTAITDASGHYSIPGLTPGTYDATFSSNGFHTAVQHAVVVAADQVTNCSVALTPARGGVTGSVVDSHGVPLVGVGVSWAEPAFDAGAHQSGWRLLDRRAHSRPVLCQLLQGWFHLRDIEGRRQRGCDRDTERGAAIRADNRHT